MKKLHALAGIIAIGLAFPAMAHTHAQGKPQQERLKADVEKLVSFGTRHTLSSATDPKRGIGAARKHHGRAIRRDAEGAGKFKAIGEGHQAG